MYILCDACLLTKKEEKKNNNQKYRLNRKQLRAWVSLWFTQLPKPQVCCGFILNRCVCATMPRLNVIKLTVIWFHCQRYGARFVDLRSNSANSVLCVCECFCDKCASATLCFKFDTKNLWSYCKHRSINRHDMNVRLVIFRKIHQPINRALPNQSIDSISNFILFFFSYELYICIVDLLYAFCHCLAL